MSTIIPELKTKYLFRALVAVLRPEIICDVGSCDASDALQFEKLQPDAKIYAFEANPKQATLIEKRLQQAGSRIQLQQKAILNKTASIEIAMVPEAGNNRGVSTLRDRVDGENSGWDRITVTAAPLDQCIDKPMTDRGMALWIDVEGHTYEVLEGCRTLTPHIAFIHAEVETQIVWKGQKLASDVLNLADDMGLMLIARGSGIQHDLVFIHPELFERYHTTISALINITRINGPLAVIVSRVLSKVLN